MRKPGRSLVGRVLGAMLVTLCMANAPDVGATPPLRDHIQIDGRDGQFEPEGKTWVDLPRNARLRQLRLEQQCTAIGGPIGLYRLVDDRIELLGLHLCSGPMPLEEIYPEMRAPVRATWLNGIFFAKFGSCLDAVQGGDPLFPVVKRLSIVEGAVISIDDVSPVQYQPPRYICRG